MQSAVEALPLVGQVVELQERLARMEDLIRQAAQLAVQQAGRADEIRAALEAATSGGQVEAGEASAVGTTPGDGAADPLAAGRIQELESQLKEKQQLLDNYAAELEDLRSRLNEASTVAATQAEQTVDMQRELEASVAELKAALAEKGEALRQKDLEMKQMEESLTAVEESLVNQIRILEDQLAEIVETGGAETGSVETTEPQKKKRTSRKAARQSPGNGEPI
jgi:hypothetical protein